ncbi:tRNA-uridine aminocarboxypropyltransferase 2 isoform X5 [Lonchura striata]
MEGSGGGGGADPGPATASGEEGEGCEGLWELPVERCERRPVCGRCSRPQKVCLCPFLPVHPLKVSTCLYIIQHPAEESRVLRTVPLLAACLPPDKCKILVGRRFNEDRYPELATVCRNPKTLILYPGAEATNLEEVAVMSSSPSVMIIIDGTWSQAKDIFYKNSLFRLPKQLLLFLSWKKIRVYKRLYSIRFKLYALSSFSMVPRSITARNIFSKMAYMTSLCQRINANSEEWNF